MNFEHIPTPETDAATLRATDIEGGGDFDAVHVQVVKRLERRLTVAREALESLAKLGNEPNYGNSIGNSIAPQAFTLTATKP